ncbi:unnamed protein product [Closterium sp. NIES-53]
MSLVIVVSLLLLCASQPSVTAQMPDGQIGGEAGIERAMSLYRSLACAPCLRILIRQSTIDFLSPRPSLLSPRSSLLAPRSSFLAPRSSLLSPRSSLISPRSSLPSPHSSLLVPRSSLLAPRSSLLAPRSPLLAPRSPLLTPPSSFLAPRSSVLVSRSLFPLTHRFPFPPCLDPPDMGGGLRIEARRPLAALKNHLAVHRAARSAPGGLRGADSGEEGVGDSRRQRAASCVGAAC